MTLDWTPRERRFLLLHALGLAGVMGLLVARFIPLARLPFWRCALREHTGWPCPGCGLTRAAEGLSRDPRHVGGADVAAPPLPDVDSPRGTNQEQTEGNAPGEVPEQDQASGDHRQPSRVCTMTKA